MLRILCLFLFPIAAFAQMHTERFAQFDSSGTFNHIRLGDPYSILQHTLRLTPAGVLSSNRYLVNSKNHLMVEGMQADYAMAYFNAGQQLSSIVWSISRRRYSVLTVLSNLTHGFGFEDRPLKDSLVYKWYGKNIVFYADTSGVQNKNIILVGFAKP